MCRTARSLGNPQGEYAALDLIVKQYYTYVPILFFFEGCYLHGLSASCPSFFLFFFGGGHHQEILSGKIDGLLPACLS